MKSTYLLLVLSIVIFSCSSDNTEVQEDSYQERFWHSGTNGSNINVYAKLNESLSDLTTEAGSFECYNLGIYAKDADTNEQWPTASHFYYTDGVGNVCEKIGYLVGGVTIYERRLDSYNVE